MTAATRINNLMKRLAALDPLVPEETQGTGELCRSCLKTAYEEIWPTFRDEWLAGLNMEEVIADPRFRAIDKRAWELMEAKAHLGNDGD